MKVVAWNQSNPIFIEVDGDGDITKRLPDDYEGLCDLNGFMYSTGHSPDGKRWWLCVNAQEPVTVKRIFN